MVDDNVSCDGQHRCCYQHLPISKAKIVLPNCEKIIGRKMVKCYGYAWSNYYFTCRRHCIFADYQYSLLNILNIFE